MDKFKDQYTVYDMRAKLSQRFRTKKVSKPYFVLVKCIIEVLFTEMKEVELVLAICFGAP